MGKNRRSSNTNSGRTSHDAATSTNLMNNMMSKNPMHTREQGQSSMMGMIDGMMDNMDGFVDKMDQKVAGIFGGGVNPAKAHFMGQTGTQMAPAPQQQMMAPQQQPDPAVAAPVAPADEGPELPPWASKLSPEAQGALKGWMSKRQERIDRRDERRARADEFLGLDMNRRRGAGRSYDL
jgi:hypothetical protein